MDPLDAFYQQLDSEDLLRRHGAELVADARQVLSTHADARVAGLITLPDSRDGDAVRAALAASTGREVPQGLLVGIVPRGMVENVLRAHVEDGHWREGAGEPQGVLPVVVSTRDGFRFGFFGLAAEEETSD